MNSTCVSFSRLLFLGVILLNTACGVNTVRNLPLEEINPNDIDAALARGQGTLSLGLVNAVGDAVVPGKDRIIDDQTIDISLLGNNNLTLVATVDDSLDVGSVSIRAGTLSSVQNEAPFSLFGDNDGDIMGSALPLGRVNLVVAVYSKPNAQGNLVAMIQLSVNIVSGGSTTGGATTGGATTGGATTGGTTTGGTTTGGTTTGGTTTGGTTTGGTTTGGTTTGDATTGGNASGTNPETNGIVTIQAESITAANSSWKIETTDGKTAYVWRGSNYDNRASSADVPSNSKLEYEFNIASPGTFKLVTSVRRESAARPLPLAGEECNGLTGSGLDANGKLCIDKENDAFIGVKNIQSPEKVYMHVTVYNNPGVVQVFPWNEWVRGGRVDRPTRQIPMYVFPAAGKYYLQVYPRSNRFFLDSFELVRVSGGGGASSSSSSSTSVGSGTTTGSTTAGDSTAGGSTSGDSSTTGGAPGVVLPGTGGCSCERAELAAGVVPNANNTGACNNTFKKSYNSSITINSAFIQANGGSKIVDSISVDGGIDIEVAGVKLCNFKARSVKIMNGVTSVLVQDGTLGSDVLTNEGQPSNFVIFRSEASGVFQRIKATGGNADAVRLSPVPSGGSQVVKQSYFGDIARYRDAGAHSDFVQTYPTVEDGKIGDWLIDQNYFEAATYSGVASGIATNAIWMAMSAGARFENNVVRRVNKGFWIESSRTNASAPIYIKNNRFHTSITGFQDASCGVISSTRLRQSGNTYMNADFSSNGTSINNCQN